MGGTAADRSTWTVPADRAKNGKAHLVHLTQPVRTTLAGLHRSKGNPHVFPGRRGGSIGGFSHMKDELLRVMAGAAPIQPGIRPTAAHFFGGKVFPGSYAAPLSGTCLEPVMFDGDMALVSPTELPQVGDLVVLYSVKGGTPWLKRLVMAPMFRVGMPLHPDSEVLPIVAVEMLLHPSSS